jgi:hypothetical protein
VQLAKGTEAAETGSDACERNSGLAPLQCSAQQNIRTMSSVVAVRAGLDDCVPRFVPYAPENHAQLVLPSTN